MSLRTILVTSRSNNVISLNLGKLLLPGQAVYIEDVYTLNDVPLDDQLMTLRAAGDITITVSDPVTSVQAYAEVLLGDIQSAVTAGRVLTEDVACDAGVAIGNLIYIDTATQVAELACAGQAALETPPAEGIVLSKDSATVCNYVSEGELVNILTLLTPGAFYYTGIVPGIPTVTVPTWAGGFAYQQVVGQAGTASNRFQVDINTGAVYGLSP